MLPAKECRSCPVDFSEVRWRKIEEVGPRLAVSWAYDMGLSVTLTLSVLA